MTNDTIIQIVTGALAVVLLIILVQRRRRRVQ